MFLDYKLCISSGISLNMLNKGSAGGFQSPLRRFTVVVFLGISNVALVAELYAGMGIIYKHYVRINISLYYFVSGYNARSKTKFICSPGGLDKGLFPACQTVYW